MATLSDIVVNQRWPWSEKVDVDFLLAGCGSDVKVEAVANTCWYGEEAPWRPHFRRGTLFGVYEFLERFAGVRMYFPDALGTVILRAERLAVPEGRLSREPAFRYRKYGYEDGPQKQSFKLLNWYRLRMETETMKCVHGHRRLRLYERFGKAHPEYFANHDNKYVREQVRRKGHLCHTSKVWEEIEKDALAYFADGGTDTFDLMPEDGMTSRCPATSTSPSPGRVPGVSRFPRLTARSRTRCAPGRPSSAARSCSGTILENGAVRLCGCRACRSSRCGPGRRTTGRSRTSSTASSRNQNPTAGATTT